MKTLPPRMVWQPGQVTVTRRKGKGWFGLLHKEPKSQPEDSPPHSTDEKVVE